MASRPRRRPRKVLAGGTRGDAAVDAMRRFGFPEDLIKTTIKELLEVYGGDGWPFLEDDAYKVLLDTILEKVEKEPLALVASSQDDDQVSGANSSNASNPAPAYSDTVVPAAETSSQVPVCSNLQDQRLGENAADASAARPSSLVPTEIMDLAFPGIEVREIASDGQMPPELIDELCKAPQGESSGLKDMDLDKDKWEVQTDIAEGSDCVEQTSSSCQSRPRVAFSVVQGNAPPRKRRRPCYGWFDDDDRLDLVELTPSPMAEEFRRRSCSRDLSQKSRRWDVRPEDI